MLQARAPLYLFILYFRKLCKQLGFCRAGCLSAQEAPSQEPSQHSSSPDQFNFSIQTFAEATSLEQQLSVLPGFGKRVAGELASPPDTRSWKCFGA